MHNILVIGGGKIGSTVADLLVATPEAGGYRVTLADRSAALLAQIDTAAQASPRLTTLVLDATDLAQLRASLTGRFAVLSAAPYHLTVQIARAAREAGVHYLDLTEDVASTRAVTELARSRRLRGGRPGRRSRVHPAVRPGTGLHLDRGGRTRARSRHARFGSHARRRAASLPEQRAELQPDLEPRRRDQRVLRAVRAIVDGQHHEVPALEEREEFSLDGVVCEAFNTSGGLGTLCDTLAGKVRTLNYRTIRYPGHTPRS